MRVVKKITFSWTKDFRRFFKVVSILFKRGAVFFSSMADWRIFESFLRSTKICLHFSTLFNRSFRYLCIDLIVIGGKYVTLHDFAIMVITISIILHRKCLGKEYKLISRRNRYYRLIWDRNCRDNIITGFKVLSFRYYYGIRKNFIRLVDVFQNRGINLSIVSRIFYHTSTRLYGSLI